MLNLKQFNLKIKKLDVIKKNNTIFCYITLEPENVICPICESNICNINDYREKKIQHSVSNNNPCFIIYKARRYKCKCCTNVFYEHNPFSRKSDKNSTYTIFAVLDKLKSHTKTFTNVAKDLFLSTSTVVRIFDQYVDVKRSELTEVICLMKFIYLESLNINIHLLWLIFLKSNLLMYFILVKKIN